MLHSVHVVESHINRDFLAVFRLGIAKTHALFKGS